jgi:hypothetical protein
MLLYTLIDLLEIHQENSGLMLEISKNLAATDSQISLSFLLNHLTENPRQEILLNSI